MTYPDGSKGKLQLSTDMAINVDIGIDPSTNAFGFDVSAAQVARLDVAGSSGTILNLDPARMDQVVRDTLMPQVVGQLSALPMTAPVLHSNATPALADTYVVLNSIGTDARYIYAFANLFEAPASDWQNPDTTLAAVPPALTHPGVTLVTVKGTDDLTPTPLLRFQHRFDNGSWSTPSFTHAVWAPATDGQHRVEIAAVDLNGNVDDTPVAYSFEVDAHPPVISFVHAPDPVERTRSFTVDFMASDDRTAVDALQYRWRLRKLDTKTGQTVTVKDLGFALGPQHFQVDAPSDGSYQLEVAAQDEAGNQSSVQATFAVVADTGCSAAPVGANAGGQGFFGIGIVLAVVLVAIRRRSLC
jgi:hypothetical protein